MRGYAEKPYTLKIQTPVMPQISIQKRNTLKIFHTKGHFQFDRQIQGTVSIFNPNGTQICKQQINRNSIPFTNRNPGLYVMKIKDDNRGSFYTSVLCRE